MACYHTADATCPECDGSKYQGSIMAPYIPEPKLTQMAETYDNDSFETNWADMKHMIESGWLVKEFIKRRNYIHVILERWQ